MSANVNQQATIVRVNSLDEWEGSAFAASSPAAATKSCPCSHISVKLPILTTPHSPPPSVELKICPGLGSFDSWFPTENMEGMLRMTVLS